MEPVEKNRHQKATDAVNEGRPVDARFVRSGGKGKSVLPILVISTLAAAVLLIGAFIIFSGTSGDIDRTLPEKVADSAEFKN